MSCTYILTSAIYHQAIATYYVAIEITNFRDFLEFLNYMFINDSLSLKKKVENPQN